MPSGIVRRSRLRGQHDRPRFAREARDFANAKVGDLGNRLFRRSVAVVCWDGVQDCKASLGLPTPVAKESCFCSWLYCRIVVVVLDHRVTNGEAYDWQWTCGCGCMAYRYTPCDMTMRGDNRTSHCVSIQCHCYAAPCARVWGSCSSTKSPYTRVRCGL